MRLAPTFCLLAASSLLPAPSHAQAPAPPEGGWVGKRVVTRHGAVLIDPRTGKVDDEGRAKNVALTGRDRGVFRIYKVERVNGPRLWLRQENGSAEGWVDARWVVPIDHAIDFHTAQIRANPSGAAYNDRANVWKAKGEFDMAIADLNEAIRLDPKAADVYNNRATAWQDKKESDKAIADYAQAIRLDPKDPLRYFNRAVVSLLTGRDGESDARGRRSSATAGGAGWRPMPP